MTTEKKLLFKLFNKLENNKVTFTDEETQYLKELIKKEFQKIKGL